MATKDDDPAPEVTPEAAQEAAKEASPDAAQEASPDAARHATQEAAPDSALAGNLARLEELITRLRAVLAAQAEPEPGLDGPGAGFWARAAMAWAEGTASNPARLIEQQAGYWGRTLAHMIEAQQALMAGTVPPAGHGSPRDPRFAGPLWSQHPWFAFLRRQYRENAAAMMAAVEAAQGLSPSERKRLAFFTRQIVDLMAPSNFLATNPDALSRAVETEGGSLVAGLENLVRDIEANDGALLVTLADPEAFDVGRNLATTPGQVVYRNRLIELIQYAPTTQRVRRTPIVLFPPWINKFYILDLKPEKSLIKWIVDQGYTLFVVSWINPDASYARTGMDDYVADGVLRAIEVAKEITGEPQVNAVGYCIAGTTLALALGVLQQRKDRSVRSATFLATLTDFTDPGEMGVFLDDDFVDAIDRHMENTGLLEARFMARTFSYLRANDLVYGPAVRSYMMGEAPPAFDLLYWNGDGTNLPARMMREYLHGLCVNSKLSGAGFDICGHRVTLRDIKVPLMSVACQTDHIAAWNTCYAGTAQMGSHDKTFVLAESGHVAGIVNPPARNRYNHHIGPPPEPDLPPDQWLEEASHRRGSWWPDWEAWIRRRSGRWVAPRDPGAGACPALEPAPGGYVRNLSMAELDLAAAERASDARVSDD